MQSKFPIGWLLAILAALILSAIHFFGLHFQHLGKDLGMDILWSILLSFGLLLIVFLLNRFKGTSIPLNFRIHAIFELICLIVFVIGLSLTVLFNNHFFVVMSQQKDIQNDVQTQVNQIDDMFEDYQRHVEDRVHEYGILLQEVEKNKESNLALYINEQLGTYTIGDLLINMRADISCGNIQEQIVKWKDETISNTKSLKFTKLMENINEINARLESTVSQLEALDRRVPEKGLNGPHWTYTLSASKDILQYFEKADDESINLWSVLSTILLGFILLLPYLMVTRDGRHKGLFWELTHSR